MDILKAEYVVSKIPRFNVMNAILYDDLFTYRAVKTHVEEIEYNSKYQYVIEFGETKDRKGLNPVQTKEVIPNTKSVSGVFPFTFFSIYSM